MNTINGNFIEKSIPNTKNATLAVNIGGVDSTMTVEKFAAELPAPASTVATVFENTLGAVPVWSRDNSFSGVYYLTLTGAFPANKTIYNTAQLSSNVSGVLYTYNITRLSNNAMEIDTTNGDSTMVNAIIEIKVYN